MGKSRKDAGSFAERSSGEQEALESALRGVRPLVKSHRKALDLPRTVPQTAVRESVHFQVTRDEDGGVEAVREGASREELGRLRSGRCAPEAELDLHGIHAEEVSRVVRDFVVKGRRRGLRLLLLVHGKGIHSEDGLGVLREKVIQALSQGPTALMVRAFSTAGERLGGRGAIVVRLVR